MTSYSFVLDANGKQLAPTKEPKAWFLIRKKRAALVSKYPMVIQLNKEIPDEEICKDEIRCGIDDGVLQIFYRNSVAYQRRSDFSIIRMRIMLQ